jgi:hypothetical protein
MLLPWPEWRTAWHDPAFVALVRVTVAVRTAMDMSFSRRSRHTDAFVVSERHLAVTAYLAPVTPRRKSEGDMPASLRNDLLKAPHPNDSGLKKRIPKNPRRAP